MLCFTLVGIIFLIDRFYGCCIYNGFTLKHDPGQIVIVFTDTYEIYPPRAIL